MENKTKILIGILVIFFVCLVTWVIRTTPTEPIDDYIEPPTVMEYENNTLVEEKDGVKIWELTTDKIRIDATTNRAEFNNVNGKFYREDGKILELTALQGYYDQDSHNVHVEGDVVVTDSDGGKLESINLDWLSAEEMLVATDDVKISKDDMRAFADRAESMNGFQKFFLKGNARILKGVKEDPAENSNENSSSNSNEKPAPNSNADSNSNAENNSEQ